MNDWVKSQMNTICIIVVLALSFAFKKYLDHD